MSTMLLPSRSLPRVAALTSYLSRSILRFSSTNPIEPTKYELSPIPANPFGEGNKPKTAAFLSIGGVGDGRFLYRNMGNFANYCATHEIALQRVEVVDGNEDRIIDSISRIAKGDYDLIVTSGGTGSLEKDITYASLAKTFGQPLEQHAEILGRIQSAMKELPLQADGTPEDPRGDRTKMALVPAQSEVLFVSDSLWMPAVRVGKIYALPGIPLVFKRLLDSLTPYLHLPERARLQNEEYRPRNRSRSSKKSSEGEQKSSSEAEETAPPA